MHHKNNVVPITMGEMVTKVTITPDAPHNFLDDLRTRHGVTGPIAVHTTEKHMKQHASKRQLERAKAYQRRTH